MSTENITIATPVCTICSNDGTVTVTQDEFDALQAGMHVQDAMPNASLDAREQIISGTHPACWNAMFGDFED